MVVSVTDNTALVEKVARVICTANGRDPDQIAVNYITRSHVKRWTVFVDEARAAISAARPAIRDEALEEAAIIAEKNWWQGRYHIPSEAYVAVKDAGYDIAAAIRALVKG